MPYKDTGKKAELNQYWATVYKEFYITPLGLKKVLKPIGHLFQRDTGKNSEARNPIHGISWDFSPYNCKEYVHTNYATDKHQASIVFGNKGKN